jgi:hypothetical protein
MMIGAVQVKLPEPMILELRDVPIRKDDRGLVGSELFEQYVVRVDPRAHTLTIYDPAAFRPEAQDTSVPLTGDGKRLYVPMRLDVKPGLSALRAGGLKQIHRYHAPTATCRYCE